MDPPDRRGLHLCPGPCPAGTCAGATPDTPLSDIDLTGLESHGGALALATIGTTIVVLPLLLVVIKLKRGSSIGDYLALAPVSLGTLAFWSGAALALMLVSDLLKWALGLPVAVDFVVDTYNSMGNPVIFMIAVAVLAPVTEELVFRGFMVSGLQNSRLGSSGAVIFTALLWAIVHLQYGLFDITLIFLLGCLLGASRIMTGSVYPAIAAHVAVNFLSYVLIGIYLESQTGSGL
ncbi:MAG: CPBP family intramembrane glutamic endopeptidase [Halioglobus sp.]|nr:CPBP family intramembrane glutamic endopeptidase [Halioglobus sp.]